MNRPGLSAASSQSSEAKAPDRGLFHVSDWLLLWALLASGCAPAESATPQESPNAPIAVKVAPVQLASIQSEVVLTGDILPAAQTELATKLSGRLSSLAVDEGRRVSKGQALAQLDPGDASRQLQQVLASLQVAESSRRSAATSLEHLREVEARYSPLAAEGGVSVQQMSDIRFQRASALDALRIAEAQVAQARAAVATAQAALDDTVIRAPFDGVVTKKLVEVGSTLAPTTPILRLATTQALELKVPVGQATLSEVRLGQQGNFTVSTFPGRTFRATVSKLAPTLERNERASSVTLRVENADGRLAPGMFARLVLPTTRHEGVPLMPVGAILREGEKSVAYVCKGQHAFKRELALGLKGRDRVEVLSGLQPGESVVTVGQGQLDDGDAIAVQP